MERRRVRMGLPGCGCTDCCVGYSVPHDEATQEDLAARCRGDMIDAAGGVIVTRKVIHEVRYEATYP